MIEGRWYVTERACRDYCELRAWPATEANLERATADLIRIAAVARFQRRQNNGLELWRVRSKRVRTDPTHYGYRLLVGDAPDGQVKQALIRVLPEHER